MAPLMRLHASAQLTCRCCSTPIDSPPPSQRSAPPASTSGRRQLLVATPAAVVAALVTADARPARATAALLEDPGLAPAVFSASAPSVVSITDFKVDARTGEETFEGVGSGIVWDAAGHIVTNYHCVSKLVTSPTGQITRVGFPQPAGPPLQFEADVQAVSPQHDLAVLTIAGAPPELLQPVRFGTSGDLRVGQYVFAVGNPAGLDRSMSSGVISGLKRAIPSPTGQLIPGVIQTDASINGGNSGGALLDSAGRLVGLNTASFTRSGTGVGSGVNFALPADLLARIVPNLIAYGNALGKA